MAEIATIIDVANRTTQKLLGSASTVTVHVYGSLPGKYRKKMAPMIKSADQDGVWVYVNAQCDPAYLNTYLKGQAFTPLIKKIEADITDTQRQKRWETPERVVSTLTKVKKLTYPKFLREFTAAEALRDDELRDLGATIQAKVQPYELKYAKTSEDYIRMYNDDYSCTGIKSYTWLSAASYPFWRLLPPAGYPPAMWIQYNPQLQGVYIEDKDGRIIARTVLIRPGSSGKYTGTTKIYGTSSGVRSMEVTLASTLGIHGFTYLRQSVPYKMPIPIIQYGGRATRIIPGCALDAYAGGSNVIYITYGKTAKKEYWLLGPREALEGYDNVKPVRSFYFDGKGGVLPSFFGFRSLDYV